MSNFFKLFKSQGGWSLVKQYWNSGVLFYAIGQLFLTGFSKKSLELLRLGVALKVKGKLKREYSAVLDKFDANYKESNNSKSKCNKVWFCWMQGIENAPSLVQVCYKLLKQNLSQRDVVLITNSNLEQYVSFPDFIIEKYKKGYITNTHFSDILRIELLCKYGGTWIDSTVLCLSDKIPSYMLDSDLFLFQNLKPGADGATINMSSWFITSCSNNKLLLATRQLLYAYWSKKDKLIDYFLLHHFMMIVKDRYAKDWNTMIQFPNSLPHVLLLNLFEQYNNDCYSELVRLCPVQKLTYKLDSSKTTEENTYYRKIMSL